MLDQFKAFIGFAGISITGIGLILFLPASKIGLTIAMTPVLVCTIPLTIICFYFFIKDVLFLFQEEYKQKRQSLC